MEVKVTQLFLVDNMSRQRGSMKELEVLKKKKNYMVEDKLGSHNVISESQGEPHTSRASLSHLFWVRNGPGAQGLWPHCSGPSPHR